MTYTKKAKTAAITALLCSGIFLAGCSIPGIDTPETKTVTKVVTVTVIPSPEASTPAEEGDIEPATQTPAAEETPEETTTPEETEVTPEATPEATATAEPTVEATETPASEVNIDAQVEAALLKYIAENKADFGKQVIESANEYQKIQQAEAEAVKAEAVKDVPGISSADHVLGDKNADFVLFEYSDYQCPFCQRFHPTSKEFIENNSDVALVFRAMPLDQLHPKARGIHEVAECIAEVGGNDAFWAFSDSVFDKEVTSNEDYESAAKKAGITDLAAVQKCVAEDRYKGRVEALVQEGASLGIQGTPTSILKNMKTGEVRLIGGAYPLEALESALGELK